VFQLGKAQRAETIRERTSQLLLTCISEIDIKQFGQ